LNNLKDSLEYIILAPKEYCVIYHRDGENYFYWSERYFKPLREEGTREWLK